MEHVKRLESESEKAQDAVFSPSQEDISRPELWKAGSWRWFRKYNAASTDSFGVGDG